jgi:oxygen-independent coproporphyrinogen-3 oxidase
MLLSAFPDFDAVRFSSADSLERYTSDKNLQRTVVSHLAALEESFFLGLRLSQGVNLDDLAANFGHEAVENAKASITEFVDHGLMERQEGSVRLTPRGRLLSNEVFERFISLGEVVR